ncbi:MAG: hypothetical protein ABIH66_07965 [bacterium]
MKYAAIILAMFVSACSWADRVNLVFEDGGVMIYEDLNKGRTYDVSRDGRVIGTVDIVESNGVYSLGRVRNVQPGYRVSEGDYLKNTSGYYTRKSTGEVEDYAKSTKKRSRREIRAGEEEIFLDSAEKVTEYSLKTIHKHVEVLPIPVVPDEETVKAVSKGTGFSVGVGIFYPKDGRIGYQETAFSISTERRQGVRGGISASYTYVSPTGERDANARLGNFKMRMLQSSYVHYPRGISGKSVSYGGGITYFNSTADILSSGLSTLTTRVRSLGYHFLLRYNSPWNGSWFAEMKYQIGKSGKYDTGGHTLLVNYSM